MTRRHTRSGAPGRGAAGALALLLGGALCAVAGCTAYRAQHAAVAHRDSGWEAVDKAPPPTAFRRLPSEGQLDRVVGEAEALKAQLAAAGRYSCCIRPPCNHCLLEEGRCGCWIDFESERPVCDECTGAWADGRGSFTGAAALELLELKRRERAGELDQGAPP